LHLLVCQSLVPYRRLFGAENQAPNSKSAVAKVRPPQGITGPWREGRKKLAERRDLRATGDDPAQGDRHTGARRHRGRCRRVKNSPRIAVVIRPLSHSPNLRLRARSAGRGSNHRLK
jgi:hypothetical protein